MREIKRCVELLDLHKSQMMDVLDLDCLGDFEYKDLMEESRHFDKQIKKLYEIIKELEDERN